MIQFFNCTCINSLSAFFLVHSIVQCLFNCFSICPETFNYNCAFKYPVFSVNTVEKVENYIESKLYTHVNKREIIDLCYRWRSRFLAIIIFACIVAASAIPFGQEFEGLGQFDQFIGIPSRSRAVKFGEDQQEDEFMAAKEGAQGKSNPLASSFFVSATKIARTLKPFRFQRFSFIFFFFSLWKQQRGGGGRKGKGGSLWSDCGCLYNSISLW